METKKTIDFQNVGDLCRRLKLGKVSRERFKLDYPFKDIANGLYAALKAQVELGGESLVFTDEVRGHILSAAKWLSGEDPKPSLMLMGMYGNGKTTLAKAIRSLVEYVTEFENGYDKRKVMRWYNVKDICRLCENQEKAPGAYLEPFKAEMIVLDDLGKEPNEIVVYGSCKTPMEDLLEERYDRQMLTIATTNLDTDQLREKYKGRLYDRFRKMFTTIVFENESFRK